MAESSSQASREAPDLDPAAILKHNDPLFALGVIVLAMVLISYGGLWVLSATRNKQIEQTTAKINAIDNEITTRPELAATLKQYTALEGVVKHIDQLLASRYIFNESWNIIKASVPKDMQFTSVSMSADNSYSVTGVAKSISSVANFSQALTNNAQISNVVPVSVDKQDAKAATLNFSLRFKVKKAGKAGS